MTEFNQRARGGDLNRKKKAMNECFLCMCGSLVITIKANVVNKLRNNTDQSQLWYHYNTVPYSTVVLKMYLILEIQG